MALVNERSTTTFSGGSGSSYWGLVQQKGPWRETAADRRNARGRAGPVLGGGIGFGGTRHAGHGNYGSISNPYQQNGSLPPIAPSQYAQRSIVAAQPLDQYFRKRTAGIRLPQKPAVGSRQPMQTGHKMGSAHADEDFQGGSHGGGMGNAGAAPESRSKVSSPGIAAAERRRLELLIEEGPPTSDPAEVAAFYEYMQKRVDAVKQEEVKDEERIVSPEEELMGVDYDVPQIEQPITLPGAYPTEAEKAYQHGSVGDGAIFLGHRFATQAEHAADPMEGVVGDYTNYRSKGYVSSVGTSPTSAGSILSPITPMDTEMKAQSPTTPRDTEMLSASPNNIYHLGGLESVPRDLPVYIPPRFDQIQANSTVTAEVISSMRNKTVKGLLTAPPKTGLLTAPPKTGLGINTQIARRTSAPSTTSANYGSPMQRTPTSANLQTLVPERKRKATTPKHGVSKKINTSKRDPLPPKINTGVAKKKQKSGENNSIDVRKGKISMDSKIPSRRSTRK